MSQLDEQGGRIPDYYSEYLYRAYQTRSSDPPDRDGDVNSFLGSLIHEGYWRRTWIIQEFIIASNFTIVFGHSSSQSATSVVPWDNFLNWVTYYNQVVPGDTSVQFILNLDRMRRSQFRDASEFTLASLIDTFQGSLCQLPHDKIYAFRGLAHDHVDGSIPVDYRKPHFEVYKDAVRFQNTASVRDGVERAVEMVHFSALVYRLLTQSSASAWQQHLRSLDSAQESEDENHNLGGKPTKLRGPTHRTRPCDPSSLARSFMGAFLKEIGAGESLSGSPPKPHDVIALRCVAIRIKHIGPPLSELRASYTATKRWTASIADHVRSPTQLEKARSLNSKLLMTLAGHPDDIRPFVSVEGAVGLVPANARSGDLVCQFWKHDTCAVLRENAAWRPEDGTDDLSYEVMGKSVLVSSIEHVDWDVAEDKTQFKQSGLGDGSWVLDLHVDLPGLMRLSLDGFGSRESAATVKTCV